MKKFLVKVNVLDEYACEPSFAYIALNDEDLEEIKALMGSFEELLKKHPDVYGIEKFDYVPDFFEDTIDEDLFERLCNEEIVEMNDYFDIDRSNITRMEFSILTVKDGQIYWKGIPKHCQYYVETPCLTKEMLFGEAEARKTEEAERKEV